MISLFILFITPMFSLGGHDEEEVTFGYYVNSYLQTNIAPGHLLLYDTIKIQKGGISTELAHINHYHHHTAGTVITLVERGIYTIDVQMTWDINGGLSLWSGPSIHSMTEHSETVGSPYSIVLMAGTFVIHTPSPHYKIAIAASSGNLDYGNMTSQLSTVPTLFTPSKLIVRSVSTSFTH